MRRRLDGWDLVDESHSKGVPGENFAVLAETLWESLGYAAGDGGGDGGSGGEVLSNSGVGLAVGDGGD